MSCHLYLPLIGTPRENTKLFSSVSGLCQSVSLSRVHLFQWFNVLLEAATQEIWSLVELSNNDRKEGGCGLNVEIHEINIQNSGCRRYIVAKLAVRSICLGVHDCVPPTDPRESIGDGIEPCLAIEKLKYFKNFSRRAHLKFSAPPLFTIFTSFGVAPIKPASETLPLSPLYCAGLFWDGRGAVQESSFRVGESRSSGDIQGSYLGRGRSEVLGLNWPRLVGPTSGPGLPGV